MRSGLAVLLGLVFCVGATAARGQTCDVTNGDFRDGTVHWSFEITGGFTYVRWLSEALDFVSENDGVGYGTSRASLFRDVDCSSDGSILQFRVNTFTSGQRVTGQALIVLLDGAEQTRFSFGNRADQVISVPWPPGSHRLRLDYEANPCIECRAILRLDDFRFQAIETPVLPVTWSRVKSRFP